MIEVALLAPWIFFLFVGVLDFGFYAYAAISVQNAARVAALQTSANPSIPDFPDPKRPGAKTNDQVACEYVLAELQALPNVRGKTSLTYTCPPAPGGISASTPVAVTAENVTGPDGFLASRVLVTYQTIPMIPIPGLLMGQFTLTRIVEMKMTEG